MHTPHSIRDGLSLFNDLPALQRAAFEVVNRMQHQRPAVQLLGTAVALKAMCESANVNLSDLLAQAQRVLAVADGPFTTHIQAIRDYAAGELRRV